MEDKAGDFLLISLGGGGYIWGNFRWLTFQEDPQTIQNGPSPNKVNRPLSPLCPVLHLHNYFASLFRNDNHRFFAWIQTQMKKLVDIVSTHLTCGRCSAEAFQMIMFHYWRSFRLLALRWGDKQVRGRRPTATRRGGDLSHCAGGGTANGVARTSISR